MVAGIDLDVYKKGQRYVPGHSVWANFRKKEKCIIFHLLWSAHMSHFFSSKKYLRVQHFYV
jgi:hypothetical protein